MHVFVFDQIPYKIKNSNASLNLLYYDDTISECKLILNFENSNNWWKKEK